MVLEYCVGGSLRRHLQQLSKARGAAATRWAAPDGYSDQPTRSKGMAEAAAADLLRQLASALLHLHALGVAHRDVKPENLLFADTAKRTIKLCDFGCARRLRRRPRAPHRAARHTTATPDLTPDASTPTLTRPTHPPTGLPSTAPTAA